MNLAIVAPTADDKPFRIPPNPSVRGYAAFACMFPGDKTFNVSPCGFVKVADKVDVVMFIPGAGTGDLSQMVEIASTFTGKKLVQDSDPPTGWLGWFPLVTMKTLELFNVCDVVVTHGEAMVDVVKCLTQTPVAHLAEPSYLASHKKRKRKSRGSLVVSVTTHCATYNSNRNAMVNYAILNQLKGIKGHPIGVMENQMEALAGEMHIDERDLLKEVGFDAQFRVPGACNRSEMFKLFDQMALMINMDFTNAIGHWQIDAAAMGTPMICADFPDASQRLFPDLCFSPYDVTSATAAAKEILTNKGFRKRVLDYAFDAVDFYSFEQTQARFCRILEIPKPEKPVQVIDESKPIILRLGSVGEIKSDVNVILDGRDSRNFPDSSSELQFIEHDLLDLPLPFDSGKVERVDVSHVLEYVPRHSAVALMKDVSRLLTRGGTVTIETPNASKAFEYGVKINPDIEKEMNGEIAWTSVTKALWGDAKDAPENQHCYGWNHFTLERMLADEVGFEIVSMNNSATWAVITEAVKHGN